MSLGKLELNNKINWTYQLNTDVDYEYSCNEYTCDYICRCARITNVKVNPLDMFDASYIIDKLYNNDEKNELDKAIATIFIKNAIKPEMFDYDVWDGYYGDELSKVFIEDDYELYELFEQFNNSNQTERLQMAMSQEYDFILPAILKINEWELKEVPIDNIIEFSVKTNFQRVASYMNYTPWGYMNKINLPPIILMPFENDDKVDANYHIIDGHHRFSAWTTRPKNIDEKKWKRMKKNKTIKAIIPKEIK